MARHPKPEAASDRTRDWLGFAAASWQLGLEASLVVPLRLIRLAQGGPAAEHEAQLMVSEKLEAHSELAIDCAAGRLGAGSAAIAHGAARHYLRYVRANRRRLLRAAAS